MHAASIDQRVIVAYMQIFLDLGAIRFKFHDLITQLPITFQSAIPGTVEDDKHSCTSKPSRYVSMINDNHLVSLMNFNAAKMD
jgi:hypothetical protein